MSTAQEVPRIAVGPEEGCKAIGISRGKFFELLRDGTIPSVKLGGRRLIRVEDLERLVAEGVPSRGDA